MSETISKRARLAMVNELLESEAYRTIVLPHFKERAEFHVRQCRARNLTPEKRAEHIEAAELAESMESFLEEKKRTLESQMRQS